MTKNEALPGLVGEKLDALLWRWCPLSGTRPVPFANRRNVAALGWLPLPLQGSRGRRIFNVPAKAAASGTLGGGSLPFPLGQLYYTIG